MLTPLSSVLCLSLRFLVSRSLLSKERETRNESERAEGRVRASLALLSCSSCPFFCLLERICWLLLERISPRPSLAGTESKGPRRPFFKASRREAYEGLDGVGTKPARREAIEGERFSPTRFSLLSPSMAGGSLQSHRAPSFPLGTGEQSKPNSLLLFVPCFPLYEQGEANPYFAYFSLFTLQRREGAS